MEPDCEHPNGKILKLHGKDLKDLDPGLFKIDLFLTKLELSPDYQSCLYYKLESLPGSIGNLKHLRELKLDTNELNHLPAEIGDLKNLERISLSNNNLKHLPDSFAYLKKLKSLHLSKNQFEKLPVCVPFLTSLIYLDMTTNRLKEIEPSITRLKHTLKFLSFYDNQIHEIGNWIEDLVNLEQLWLGCNRLKQIPFIITVLKKLDWESNYLTIILDNNPIELPPLNVCHKGFTAIRNWYIDNDYI